MSNRPNTDQNQYQGLVPGKGPAVTPVIWPGLAADYQQGIEARAAALRVARTIVGQDSGQAHRARAILCSLFGHGAVKLSEVDYLAWNLRRDICILVLGFNCSGCPDSWIRDAFREIHGEAGVRWFLKGISESEVEPSEE